MTNAEKYLKDGVESRYFATALYKFILTANRNVNEQNSILGCINTFLELPIKPILTEDEKVILRQLKKNYSIIGKNKYFSFILKETIGGYEQTGVSTDIILTGLFQFIQPRRRI